MKKVPTGIEGLDSMLGGGLPFGRCTLVCGGPGSGKTTFCIQFLYNGATKYGETGLHVSLDESPNHIKENMYGFGWDLSKLEKDQKLLFFDASPFRRQADKHYTMLNLKEIIRTKTEENQVKRIAIDPVNTLVLQYPDVTERRNAVLELMGTVADLGVTTLITTELRATSLERQVQIEEFLSHGVIIFHNFNEGMRARIVKAIQIEKMRGFAHDQQIRPYKILENGINVFSEENIISRT
jgi:circadian clock protein KaiC